MADTKDLSELIDETMKEQEYDATENIAKVTIGLIENTQGVTLTEEQIKICTELQDKTGNEIFEDLLTKYSVSKDIFGTINICFNIINGLASAVDLCNNVGQIYEAVNMYTEGNEVSAATILSVTLDTLGNIISFIPGCDLISYQLTLGSSVLDVAGAIVQKRVNLYEDLEALLDEVMGGTSTAEQQVEMVEIYQSYVYFVQQGGPEGIKLYKAILDEYGWIFELAGVDMTEMNARRQELEELEEVYINISPLIEQISILDVDHDGIITSEEISLNVEKVTASEKSEQQVIDPIVLDLNKNGKYTTDTENGTYFDYAGDGFAEKTAWAENGDGLLVYDRNGNGIVDNGSELFGDKTVLLDGSVASNGFEALSELDTNGDGIINKEDEKFDHLRVWIDANNDGISQEDELFSLSDLKIIGLNLGSTVTNEKDENGNVVARKSTIIFDDGSQTDRECEIFSVNS
ncbi:MAG: hypothetical protein ACI4EN_09750 [Butyrivibrio sp.]